MTWPNAILVLGILAFAFLFSMGILATIASRRRDRLALGQEDSLRKLVSRYEQLAENTMDAQQRVATDVSELRARTASIEQILRTVE
jgi:hypothetical protein